MKYNRMIMEAEAPDQFGRDKFRYNLAESGVQDRHVRDLGIDLSDIELLYGPHQGRERLRELVASQGTGVSSEDVLITAAAAGALFIVATALLDRGDHLVVVRPNYSTNIDTPNAIGCDITYIDLSFDEGFSLDIDEIERSITAKTKYISITCPHNPTGATVPLSDLKRLAEIAEKNDCYLLVDETYRELTFSDPYPTAASLSDRVIAVASISKSYGVPGLRVGWVITRDKSMYELFLAAKEHIMISGSVIDEYIAMKVLEQGPDFLVESRKRNFRHFEIVREWMAGEPYMEWVEPTGGVLCFPRLKVDESFDCDEFYRSLVDNHGAYVAPGYWFRQPKNYMRIGYGHPAEEELKQGLAAISKTIREQIA